MALHFTARCQDPVGLCVASCFSAMRVLGMGLNVEQNRRKKAMYPMQQEAGIRRREQFTLTWTC